MFADAYEIARQFTFPLIVNMRYFDKTIEGGLGSFVILNDDGWLMTAAHNFGASFAHTQHQKEITDYNEKIQKIQSNPQLKDAQRNKLLRAIGHKNKWVTNFEILLSGQPLHILESFIYGQHDIAFIRIDKSAIKDHKVFPKIIDPSKGKLGTSLCKLGFPFVEFRPAFDEITNRFELPSDLMPLPLFPIEGIYTRNLLTKGLEEGGIRVQFLETSSPGLRGQSGGPIFDTEGTIYAIQSKNITLPLGFIGNLNSNGKTIEENQFFNVGIGVHPETLKYFLDKHQIKYELKR